MPAGEFIREFTCLRQPISPVPDSRIPNTSMKQKAAVARSSGGLQPPTKLDAQQRGGGGGASRALACSAPTQLGGTQKDGQQQRQIECGEVMDITTFYSAVPVVATNGFFGGSSRGADGKSDTPFGLRAGDRDYSNLSGGDFLAILASSVKKAGRSIVMPLD